MDRTSAPAARPGYLRRIWPVVATLLLLAGLSGCGGESPEVLPPTAQAPAQETPLTPVLPTPTTALAPVQETRETPAPPPTTARTPTQETPPTTVLPTPATAGELRSDRDRDNSPPASRADLRELVRGNNDFAFDLYRALNDAEGNLFYSPFSISQALAMTFAGARGETENARWRKPFSTGSRKAIFIPHSTLWTGRLPREARIPWVRSKLDFAHFKRRKQGNRQVGGTERPGLSVYQGRRRTVKNPPTPATGGGAPERWHPRRSATAWRTKPLCRLGRGSLLPQQMGRQGGPGEEPHQDRRGASDGLIRPLALGLHAQMRPHLLEGDLQLPAQHKTIPGSASDPPTDRCRARPGE